MRLRALEALGLASDFGNLANSATLKPPAPFPATRLVKPCPLIPPFSAFARSSKRRVWRTFRRRSRTNSSRLQLANKVRPGQTVAITAGSRGIANIAKIIHAVVRALSEARGAAVHRAGDGVARRRHGGGAGGVARRLWHHRARRWAARSGRAWRRSSSARRRKAFPVHFDKFAYGADHVCVVGRVKPHTGFVGDIESGLMKMMLIGLGKHEGAKIYHRAIMDYSFGQIVRRVAREVLSKCRIVCGLGIVENAYDQTALTQSRRAAGVRRPREGAARSRQAMDSAAAVQTAQCCSSIRSARTSAGRGWTRTSSAGSTTTTWRWTTSGRRSSGFASAT